jgi:hypothetical protein
MKKSRQQIKPCMSDIDNKLMKMMNDTRSKLLKKLYLVKIRSAKGVKLI